MRGRLRIGIRFGLGLVLAAGTGGARADDVASKRAAFISEVDKLMAVRTPASEGSGSGTETRAVRRYEEGAQALQESLLAIVLARTRSGVAKWAGTGDASSSGGETGPVATPVAGGTGTANDGEARFLEELTSKGREFVLAKARLDLLRGMLAATNSAYPKRKEAIIAALKEAETGLASGDRAKQKQGRTLACNVEETLLAQSRSLDTWLDDAGREPQKFDSAGKAFDEWCTKAPLAPDVTAPYLDALGRWSNGYWAARKDYGLAWARAVEIRDEVRKGKVCADCKTFRDVPPDAVCRTAKEKGGC